MEFWKRIGSPKYICAPMVNQSWLPFRRFVHQQGVQLSYTPMVHAKLLLTDEKYLQQLISDLSDSPRPVIVQMASNKPSEFAAAVHLVKDLCDAVDLNLGCPQHIAKSGHYGAYLMKTETDIKLIEDILKAGAIEHNITAKIRVYESIEETVSYAQRIEAAGVSALAVHGRTIEQKKDKTGLASWEHIKAVKNSISLPVIANGNIRNE